MKNRQILWQAVVRYPWGATSFFLLVLSVLSGIMVGLQYDPGHPFYAVVGIDLVVPFGRFWRSLHFWASQLFVLAVAGHFAVVAVEPHPRLEMGWRRWSYLVGSLVVLVLLLFSGYVLRGDVTGDAAGRIAEHILLALPVFGRPVNDLLFALAESGLKRVFLAHLVTLPLAWLFLSWAHVRRYTVAWDRHPWLLFLVLLFCTAVPAPLEPASPALRHVQGPWFFLAVQELLRHLPVLLAGIVYPLTLVVALLALYRWRRPAAWVVLLWILSWGGLTLVALGR